jgi:hypothetical protein
MAWVESNRELQIAIGRGTPPAGKLTKGGIAISLNAAGVFTDLYTSTDGANVARLSLTAINTEKLQGKTVDQIQASVISAISSGASGAYNTLKELEDELKKEDSKIATLVTNLAKKVDKVSGKSLILNTLITKLTNLPLWRKDAYSNSVVQRNGQDINTRLFRTEYTSLNPAPNYFVTMVATGKGSADNYMRPTSVAQVRAKLGVQNGSQKNPKIMEF